jgi:hypothetical protein
MSTAPHHKQRWVASDRRGPGGKHPAYSERPCISIQLPSIIPTHTYIYPLSPILRCFPSNNRRKASAGHNPRVGTVHSLQPCRRDPSLGGQHHPRLSLRRSARGLYPRLGHRPTLLHLQHRHRAALDFAGFTRRVRFDRLCRSGPRLAAPWSAS